MRNYLTLIFIIISLLPVRVSGQMTAGRLDISVYSGYATYRMEMPKEINKSLEESLPFEVKTINNFDPGFYFGAAVQSRISSGVALGLVFQYHTTGSRLGQKDYSGSYTFDQIANCYLAGIKPEFSILDSKKYTLSASVTSAILFTELEISESFILYDNANNDSESLSALSFSIYPALNFSIPVTRRFIWFISSGILFDTGGKIHLTGDKDAVLKTEDDNLVKTGWSGLRISTGLNFIIMK